MRATGAPTVTEYRFPNPKRSAMSTQTVTNLYRLASEEGLADVWWKSGRATIKAGPDETGNAFSQLVMDEPRGSATPTHIHHNEDETFYVLEGQVTMFSGDERIDLEAD